MKRLKIGLRIIYVLAVWGTLQEIKTTKGKIWLIVLIISLCSYECLVFIK